MNGDFHLFVYGTLKSDGKSASLLSRCELIGTGKVGGILYDIDGRHPALVLYGTTPVEGEVWRCPFELLSRLDDFEGIEAGWFRRVGVSVEAANGALACWTYVAGPRLARKLVPARRIEAWTNPGAAQT